MPSTPDEIGREAGKAIADAIADGIEGILLKMADKLAQLQAEQAEMRDGMLALSNRIEGAHRLLALHGQALKTLDTNDVLSGGA